MSVYNDGETITIQDEQALEFLLARYIALINPTKVRTRNVLDTWRYEFSSDKEFLEHFLSAPSAEIKNRRNCGRLTVSEILSIRDELLRYIQENDPDLISVETKETPGVEELHIPANFDDLLPLFKPTMTGLSTRSARRVEWLLEECGNSLSKFYKRITDPNCIREIPTIGRKSRPELIDFFARSKEFFQQFLNEESVSERVKHHLVASPNALGLPDDAKESLSKLEESLGHFPLFAAIQLYFDNRPVEEKVLIKGCLDIYEGQELEDRQEVASRLNLTQERIRQRRNKLIKRLPEYFKTYASLGFIKENPYHWQMTHVEVDINASEGTNFNLNFVTLVLCSVFDDLTLIGDQIKCIGGYFDLDMFLYIVPTSLVLLFDFDAFLQDIDERMKEKRINEEKVNLRSIISSHLKVQYCEDELPEIDTTCRTILYLHYPVEVDQGNIIFPANAYKTNSVIVEEIIRKAGRPLTIDEIMEDYMYQYPERNAIENSIRSAIGGNKNIVAVGRTSTYALAEWSNGEYRGGTIRQFVLECIDQSPEKIATTSAIAEYVMQFRPETNEINIVSNISLDPEKILSFYYKDGIRYLGYTDHEYPDEYFPLESDFRTSSANSLYYLKLIGFIKLYHRFPFSNGDLPDENALRGFWRRQEYRFNKGNMDAHALKYYEKITAEYGHLKIDKGKFEWMVIFAHAAAMLGIILPEEEHYMQIDTQEDLSKWLAENMYEYIYRQKYMPKYRIDKMHRVEEKMLASSSDKDNNDKKEDLNVQDNLG